MSSAVAAPVRVRARRTHPTARVVVVIPAHNEEVGIEATVQSIFDQTIKVHRVIVMSDNSTDRTVELARAAGAEVYETVDNKVKKAGAVNQGFGMVVPLLDDSDFVMTMDADGALAPDAIEVAFSIFAARPDVGGVGGSVLTRNEDNWLEAAQAVEYARGRRLMSRQGGRISVLPGACAIFKVSVLREVAALRGAKLPGRRGLFMVEDSLVEDFELSLAVQELGYKITSSKRVKVVTDLMPTLRMLEAQRMRWYRGTMETLVLYGVKPYTWKIFLAIAFSLGASMLLPLAVLALIFLFLTFGALPGIIFLVLAPLFIIENFVCARRTGSRKAKVMALSFFPLWGYDMVIYTIYWRSLWHALSHKAAHWDGDEQNYED